MPQKSGGGWGKGEKERLEGRIEERERERGKNREGRRYILKDSYFVLKGKKRTWISNAFFPS